jgi:hypothetical protein
MIEAADSLALERFSTEQQQLVRAALALLASPRTVRSGPYYTRRRMTRKEKTKWLMGMVVGSTLGDFSEKVVGERTILSLEVRSADIKHGPDTSSGGGVYLQQERVCNFDQDTIVESLTLFASSVTNGKFSFTDKNDPKREVLWQINLLEPIDDTAEIKRFQLELDAAAERFRHNE